jgi:hypothetical protein
MVGAARLVIRVVGVRVHVTVDATLIIGVPMLVGEHRRAAVVHDLTATISGGLALNPSALAEPGPPFLGWEFVRNSTCDTGLEA